MQIIVAYVSVHFEPRHCEILLPNEAHSPIVQIETP